MDRQKIELVEEAKPYHGKPYMVPKAYEEALKKGIDRLVKIGILRKVNHWQCLAPYFVIPRKDQTIRFITDFSELNKRVKRHPFPLPKIQDMLLKMEGFQYTTSFKYELLPYKIRCK